MTLAFDHRGLLPAGCHECADWTAFEGAFAFNDRRRMQLGKLKDFIGQELLAAARGLEMVVGGSYVSDKPDPSDIDCTVAVSKSLAKKRAQLFLLAADGDKQRIYRQYGVEFYLTIQEPGRNDFRAYFSYVGEKTALARGLQAKDIRGTVRVKRWAKL